MRKFTVASTLLFIFAFLAMSHTRANAQGTAFTYQGSLNNAGSPASGSYDLRFAIFDAATSGVQQGNILTNAATAVSNGLFTVTLDFGNQFSGANRWLEIGVRTNGTGTFNTLTSRQALTATPYAVRAASAGTATSATSATSAATATTATSFSGSLTGDVTGTQSATVVSTVGGLSAANVAGAANLANAATTANTIVKRDASGNFSAGTITANNISAPNLLGTIFMAGVVNPNNLTPFWTTLNGDSIGIANGQAFGAPMPVACTVASLMLRVDAVTAGLNKVTVTLYTNGVATAIGKRVGGWKRGDCQ